MTEQSDDALVERFREAAQRAQCFAAEAGLSEDGFAGRWSAALKEVGRELFKAANTIEALYAREATLCAENATLAAGSCDVPGGKVGDEHGHFYCTLERQVASAKEQAERLAEALEGSQLGLTVLADMLKRIGSEKGEKVAVEIHRNNTQALATYREKQP